MRPRFKKSQNDFLICHDPRDEPTVRMICFPCAGANASFYKKWNEQLSTDIQIWGVQYPGRDFLINTSEFPDVNKLGEALAEDIALSFEDIPLCFYGHSFGALVAYETARILEHKYGKKLVKLVVSARKYPGGAYDKKMSTMTDNELIHELNQFGGIPIEIKQDKEMLEYFVNQIRKDLTLNERYTLGENTNVISAPIDVYGGTTDSTASSAELEQWRGYTDNSFDLKMIAGGHFFINNPKSIFFTYLQKEFVADEEDDEFLAY